MVRTGVLVKLAAGRRAQGGERGVELVEVAITLPMLLLVLAATAEMGRLFSTYTTLARGTRVAARYLTSVPLNTATNRTIHYAKARNLVVYGTATPADGAAPIVAGLTVNHVLITESGGVAGSIPDFVAVQISGLNFQPLFDLGGMIGDPTLSLSVALSPRTTMRHLLTQPIN